MKSAISVEDGIHCFGFGCKGPAVRMEPGTMRGLNDKLRLVWQITLGSAQFEHTPE